MSGIIAFVIGFMVITVIATVIGAVTDAKKHGAFTEDEEPDYIGKAIDVVLENIPWNHGMISDR